MLPPMTDTFRILASCAFLVFVLASCNDPVALVHLDEEHAQDLSGLRQAQVYEIKRPLLLIVEAEMIIRNLDKQGIDIQALNLIDPDMNDYRAYRNNNSTSFALDWVTLLPHKDSPPFPGFRSGNYVLMLGYSDNDDRFIAAYIATVHVR